MMGFNFFKNLIRKLSVLFHYKKVIDFWFDPKNKEKFFIKDNQFDAEIRRHFLSYHSAAIQGELFQWRENTDGRLAEIIILDQFSRNMFRNTPESFMYDSIALVLTQEALLCGADKKLSPQRKTFMYLPMMHSESTLIHEHALEYFNQPGLETGYKYELLHKKIIDRFGRYPHRNEILNRQSTEEEIEFLKEENSSF